MRWTESIIVDRPISQVAAAIADENELMRWSAWPEATGYTCSVDGTARASARASSSGSPTAAQADAP